MAGSEGLSLGNDCESHARGPAPVFSLSGRVHPAVDPLTAAASGLLLILSERESPDGIGAIPARLGPPVLLRLHLQASA